MTASTDPTASADSTPVKTELYAISEQAAAVYAAAETALAALGEVVLETIPFRDEMTFVVERERIREIITTLRQDEQTRFDRLSDLTAVDYLPLGNEPRFAVVYHLMSRSNLTRLRLRVPVPEADPLIDSVTDLFPSANWLEREVFDLLGITFVGHPDLKRIVMPDDWDGHPLRKDYPIGAEEVEFSFNHEVIEAERPQSTAEREDRYRPERPVNNF